MTDDSTAANADPDNEVRALLQRALDGLETQKNSALAWSATAVGAFNAGALATSLNLADKIEHSEVVISIFSCALGFAFVTAATYAYAMSETWDKVDAALDFIKLAPVDRTLDNTKGMAETREFFTEILHLPILCGVVTIVLSLVGIVIFAFTINLNDDANTRRCIAIQRDMLSAQPRRADGPDLFQALGCRPQGTGPAFAKPTKLERAAGHALPEGGRR